MVILASGPCVVAEITIFRRHGAPEPAWGPHEKSARRRLFLHDSKLHGSKAALADRPVVTSWT
jgi:hypothetical protein